MIVTDARHPELGQYRTQVFSIFMYGAGLRLLRFFFLKIIVHAVLLWEQLFQIFRWLAGNILNGNTLADIGGVVRMALRGVNVQIPDELVVDDKALGLFLPVPCTSYTSM